MSWPEFLNLSGLVICVTKSLNHKMAPNVLSFCWLCHFSSYFWSIVRKVTCVYDSSAVLWRSWNQKMTCSYWQCYYELSCPGQLKRIRIIDLRPEMTALTLESSRFKAANTIKVVWGKNNFWCWHQYFFWTNMMEGLALNIGEFPWVIFNRIFTFNCKFDCLNQIWNISPQR